MTLDGVAGPLRSQSPARRIEAVSDQGGAAETDRAGRTALHYAALSDDVAAAESLLTAGADPNAADKAGWTPLHFAAQQEATAVARLLLSRGAEVDRQDSYGNTPLFRAVFGPRQHGELIILLREHGADPLKANNHGQTPAGLAQVMGNAQWLTDVPL
jgi:ankyrin repeat protein